MYEGGIVLYISKWLGAMCCKRFYTQTDVRLYLLVRGNYTIVVVAGFKKNKNPNFPHKIAEN